MAGIFSVYFSPHKQLYQSLKNILGFYPQNISLYLLAFRHRSAGSDNKENHPINNERLEYLGDAVLGAVVAHYLFKTFPYKDEGFLTKMRSRIVSRVQLNQVARKIGLDELINASLSNKAKFGSITGDAFEALIGAIYLDKGYKEASGFIINRIIKLHLNIDDIENKETDFKSRLIEWSQKEKQELVFEILEEPSHENNMQYKIGVMVNGVEKGRAINFSKKKAEQIAAEAACNLLQL